MSTGLECYFLKRPKTGEWFYVLQSWDCPTCCFDWREYAKATGPFTTEEEAERHLHDNHANPGGSHTSEPEELDEVETKLVANAIKPQPKSLGWSFRPGRGW